MRPLGKRVVIEREAIKDTVGSIVIPESSRIKPTLGRVIAVGGEVTTLKVGDRVLFGKHSTLDIEGTGVFIWERDVMAVLEDPSPAAPRSEEVFSGCEFHGVSAMPNGCHTCGAGKGCPECLLDMLEAS